MLTLTRRYNAPYNTLYFDRVKPGQSFVVRILPPRSEARVQVDSDTALTVETRQVNALESIVTIVFPNSTAFAKLLLFYQQRGETVVKVACDVSPEITIERGELVKSPGENVS